MPLKKSCCNLSLFLHTLRRFSPIWIVLSLCCLAVPLELYNVYLRERILSKDVIESSTQILLLLTTNTSYIVACGYAVIVATALFSYLYVSKSALGTHALPVTRKTIFVTYFLTGLAMLALPLAILCAVTVPVLLITGAGVAIPLVFQFCAVTFGIYLFFFSFAVFCGMFTGQAWGLPLFYAIFNAIVAITFALFYYLCETYLFGFVSDSVNETFVRYCTPFWLFASELYHSVNTETGLYALQSGAVPLIAIYAAIGILFAVAAYALFRKRNLESAGEIVCVRIMRPLFALCCAVYSGILFMTLIYQIFSNLGTFWVFFWLFFGVFFGFFLAQMLLCKSIAVFSKKRLAHCLAIFCACAVLVSGVYFDLLGFHSYVPDVSEIESATIDTYSSISADSVTFGMNSITVNSPEDLKIVTDIHSAIIRDYDGTGFSPEEYGYRFSRPESQISDTPLFNNLGEAYHTDYDTISYFRIDYTLTTGQVISRRFYIHISTLTVTTAGMPAYHFQQLVKQTIDIPTELDARRGQFKMELHSDNTGEWAAVDPALVSTDEIFDAMLADFAEREVTASLLRRYYENESTYTLEGHYNGSFPYSGNQLNGFISLHTTLREGTQLYALLLDRGCIQ